ncbi:hypothetical protein [Bradyrhizobium sp. 150]|uniref:hypothetical protein n=1 Tax=Bradyrhizobium sp. 150 TaxID=2782625 RepID=UPI001FF92F84|nr:hypothetical protein [Bradyrhizobium sp. 150]MCK1670351.1 hypothetical protein [Bradyrhizobium sp. 150]
MKRQLHRQLRRQWRRFTKVIGNHSLALGVGAHGAVIGSCAASIATQPLTWWTVLQGALVGWCIGAILMLVILHGAIRQNRLTRLILDDFGKAIEARAELQIENFAMRQYFRTNNIEFTVIRDGDSISATAEYKGPANRDATDDHEREDRTVH